MRKNYFGRLGIFAAALFAAGGAFAAPSSSGGATQLIAISADIVEISGSLEKTRGFSWNTSFDFAEKSIPGVFKIDQFERKTNLATTLKLLETESKAQILSNPKVIAKSGTTANFMVGGEFPVPVTNNQGVGAEFKKFGVSLMVLPVVLPEKNNSIDVQIQLEVSNTDYSKTVTVGGTTVPSVVTRQVNTEVELQSGETIVIGGLKSNNHNVNISRVPILGKLPLIGALFTLKDVVDDQRSLFLFITVETVK